MKPIRIALLLSLAAVSAFASPQQETGIRIGISKIVEHPALNAVEQGIMDEMASLGYDDVTYDLENAAGDMNVAGQIAAKFAADKVDVAVGIATPTAIALASAIRDIPVVFTAVTDPVDAGLVDDLDSGKGNVTGVSDLTPVRAQIELLVDLTGAKTIGHVFTAGEPNAVKLAVLAEAVADDLGLKFVATSITDSSQVKQAAEAIVNQVDAFYISTDNTVYSALPALLEVANAAGKPVVTADPSSYEELPLLAAYGFDYYAMGRVTGKLVDRILNGANPADIPTQFLTDPEDLILALNLDIAKQLGIDVPQRFIDQAGVLIQDGKATIR